MVVGHNDTTIASYVYKKIIWPATFMFVIVPIHIVVVPIYAILVYENVADVATKSLTSLTSFSFSSFSACLQQ